MENHQRQLTDTATRPEVRASVAAHSLPGSIRYDVSIQGDAFFGIPDREYFLEVTGDVVPPAVERFDFVVLSLIFFAMHHETDLHISGPVSRQLLVDLEEFQRAWTTWKPQRYRRIRISCDAEVPPASPAADARAVLAFSGGVDSACAMLDLLKDRGDRDHRELVAAVLILGFDVGMEKHAGLAATLDTARAMTQIVGVPLSIVRTNFRACLSHEWPDEFGAAVATCLSIFAPVAGVGLLASDDDYRQTMTIHGSNMVTNPMLSSDSFRVVTCINALTRTQRVARVAACPAIADRIRVCWEGPMHGWNCGRCEKCLRTKLNFLAAGAPLPTSLAPTPGIMDIIGIAAKDARKIFYLEEILDADEALPRPLRLTLRMTVWKNRLLLPWRRWRRVLRAAARKLRGLPPR